TFLIKKTKFLLVSIYLVLLDREQFLECKHVVVVDMQIELNLQLQLKMRAEEILRSMEFFMTQFENNI
ncbi:MAG: hypothetical protein CEN91_33, partial [Candidatus Berkelbacteria bacterium Licking1014_85]